MFCSRFGRSTRLAAFWLLTLLAAVWLTACGQSQGAVGEWPEFRGPGGRGHAVPGPYAKTWSGEKNVVWKTAIPGTGNSSPIVSGNHIYVTSVVEVPGTVPTADGKPTLERSVIAVDLDSGKLLWRAVVFTAPAFDTHYLSTGATPTAVTDGRYIFAFFGSHLGCVDRDGKLIWVKEVDPTYKNFVHYGVATSPILVGPWVIASRDKETGDLEVDKGWLAAFNRKTGEQVWRREWHDNCCTYTTPVLHEREGQKEILFSHAGKLSAYHPATGRELWSFQHPMLQPVASIVAEGSQICYLGGAHRDRGNICYEVTGHGDAVQTKELWYVPGASPETSSPVLYQGVIYTLQEVGVVRMYDFKTGEIRFIERLPGDYFRASLVVADGHLYTIANDSTATVIKPTQDHRRFEIVATNHLNDPGNNATPAFSRGKIILRSPGFLYAIAEPAKS